MLTLYSGFRARFLLVDRRFTPTRGRRFFNLTEFFRNVSGFFEGSFWISQVIFLNFSGRLLINSRSIIGKNWEH